MPDHPHDAARPGMPDVADPLARAGPPVPDEPARATFPDHPDHPGYPDPRTFDSLVDLLDDAAVRYAGRTTLSLRTDAGIELAWTPAELRHRARLAAWRLRALGLEPGDRLLTWSPSTPRLPAVYWGAQTARLIVVPLDLRMVPEVVQRIAAKSETHWLAVGTGLEAPDPVAAGLHDLAIHTIDELTADADDTFPPDWEAQLDSWPRPTRDDVWEVIYTSGSTGYPKGVMLSHGTVLSTVEACALLLPPREHRAVSLLPLSHLFEQAPVLFYGSTIGADVLYVRSRNPRVIFESLRDHHVTTMVVTPQLMDLFWNAIAREVERQGKKRAFDRLRSVARRLPYPLRRLLFRKVHAQLGGRLRLFVVAGAFLPPETQQNWEDLGVVVVQGYGATECGPAAATSEREHPTSTVGRTVPPVRIRLAENDKEILVAGPTVMPGYWRDPDASSAVLADGWYHTGDIGRYDERGNLVLSGRKKNIIVLPSGLNVYPEDIENVLQEAGIGQSVVLETTPGRIEAVVLPVGSLPLVSTTQAAPERPTDPEGVARQNGAIGAAIKSANARLSAHSRIDAWRLWPELDFPRTHTLKIKRDDVRLWVAADGALPVREG
ncbi:MAG: AMP-binding protein [Candidatus Limnocylindrales bacterium]